MHHVCSGRKLDQRIEEVVSAENFNGATMVYLTQSRSFNHSLESRTKPSLLARFIDFIYDRCAEYNLRYCHVRGFIRHDNYLSTTVKDIIILVCFLIANLVVLLAIVLKTIVHMYFTVKVFVNWLIRLSKMKADADDAPLFIKLSTGTGTNKWSYLGD